MNQLKKLLALVLALVMTMGLSTIGANAIVTGGGSTLKIESTASARIDADASYDKIVVDEGGVLNVMNGATLAAKEVTINGYLNNYGAIETDKLTTGKDSAVNLGNGTATLKVAESAELNSSLFGGFNADGFQVDSAATVTVAEDVDKAKIEAVADSATTTKIENAPATEQTDEQKLEAAKKAANEALKAAEADAVKDDTTVKAAIAALNAELAKTDATAESITAATKALTDAIAAVEPAEEEETGPFSFKLSYGSTDATNFAKVTDVEQAASVSALNGTQNVTYTTGITKEGVLTKDNVLAFKVATLGGFTNTVEVTMGGKAITPASAVDTTDTAEMVYTIEKVTGDIEINVSTAKTTERTLTLIGTNLGAPTGSTPIELYVDGLGAYKLSLTTTTATEVTKAGSAATSTLTLKVPQGAKVTVENNTFFGSKSNADYNLADGVVGKVVDNSNNDYVAFTMPEKDLTLTEDLFDSSNKNIVVYYDSSLVVAKTSGNATQKGNSFVVDTTATFSVKSPTGGFIVVDEEDALVGTYVIGKSDSAGTTGALTATKYIKPAVQINIDDSSATITLTDKATPVGNNDGVVPGTPMLVTTVKGKGTVVAATSATATYFSGENVAVTTSETSKTWAPEVSSTLYAASMVTLNDMTATLNGTEVKTGDYVTVGTPLELLTGSNSATADNLAIKLSKGAVPFIMSAGKLTGVKAPAKITTSNLTLNAGVTIDGADTKAVKVYYGTPTDEADPTTGTTDAGSATSSNTIYIKTETPIYVVGATAGHKVTAKDADTAKAITLNEETRLASGKYCYTYTTGAQNVTLTEATDGTAGDDDVVFTIDSLDGIAYIDLATVQGYTTIEALHGGVKAAGSQDLASITTGTTYTGNFVKITNLTTGAEAIYKKNADIQTYLAGIDAGTELELDFGYYSVTVSGAGPKTYDGVEYSTAITLTDDPSTAVTAAGGAVYLKTTESVTATISANGSASGTTGGSIATLTGSPTVTATSANGTNYTLAGNSTTLSVSQTSGSTTATSGDTTATIAVGSDNVTITIVGEA